MSPAIANPLGGGRSLASASRPAPPGRHGQAVSTYFVACYCGLILLVIGTGVASGFIGDVPAVLALSILIAALCTFALASSARTPRHDRAAVTR